MSDSCATTESCPGCTTDAWVSDRGASRSATCRHDRCHAKRSKTCAKRWVGITSYESVGPPGPHPDSAFLLCCPTLLDAAPTAVRFLLAVLLWIRLHLAALALAALYPTCLAECAIVVLARHIVLPPLCLAAHASSVLRTGA